MKKLSELTEKRRRHVESCRENGDKSHETIASLYSDPSHFIYELLQNADDAGAPEVRFDLTSEKLSFIHNSPTLFNYWDVDAITTVGSSTKKDDINKIGKFGAGFKSVFAITKTPRVYSGSFHFKITDFIIPEEIEPAHRDEKITKIILPFNNEEKISPRDAYDCISDRLKELASESLLFLRNIRKIKWKTESNGGHYLSEIDGKSGKASIISLVNGENNRTDYFLTSKEIKIDDAPLNIVVAYQLDGNGNVQLISDSRLFVFFPSERTGLKFLVHAPYKTTPNRETIPFEDNQNESITEELSELVAESIIKLRDGGLLSVDTLSILPISSDERERKHPLYLAIFEKVKSVFAIEKLLPTSEGDYTISSEAILAREKELADLLKVDDCKNLFDDRWDWLSTDITHDKAKELQDYLIKELGIPQITMKDFCLKLDEKFMKTKPDNWIVSFYSRIIKNEALYGADGNFVRKGVLRRRPIIRLENDSHVCPENMDEELQVYLPAKEGQSKFKTVKRNLVKNKEVREFLEKLGLKRPDGIAEIKEFILPKYQEESISVEDKEFTDDFKRVMDIWKNADAKKKDIVNLLKESPFIPCENSRGDITYQKSADVYFPTQDLKEWFHGNTQDAVYFLKLPFTPWESTDEFIKALDIGGELRISGAGDYKLDEWGNYRRGINGFNPKFNIHGLEHALKNITFKRSVFLWKLLLKNTNKLKGSIKQKTNKMAEYGESGKMESMAMRRLNEYTKWLYDDEQNLITLPLDQIGEDHLSDEYQKNDENINELIKVLGLKLDDIREFEEKTGMKAVSPEDYEMLQEIKKKRREAKRPEQQKKAETESPQKSGWTPEVKPDEPEIKKEKFKGGKRKLRDLSGQTPVGNKRRINLNDNGNLDGDTDGPQNKKKMEEIGIRGEKYAKRYLEREYPSKEVVWLNENGNVGRGYDFVVRENGKDIAYYEVKTKTDEKPRLFQISGAQWDWANQLYDADKGDMYRILLVSNAGKNGATATPIINPVKLWKEGELYAHPVNIKI